MQAKKRTICPHKVSPSEFPRGPLTYGLTNDYMFRAILQRSNNVLKHLLAALLDIEVSQIISCEITNPIVPVSYTHLTLPTKA